MLDFYKGKKVLVTGHTGFKGSWLSRILIKYGASVYGLALAPEINSIMSKTGDFGFVENEIIDIRDREKLNSFISSHKFDGVFHLAAQPLVRRSYKEPVETFETNVMGTINLMNALMVNEACPWAILITTDKVYQNVEKMAGYREEEPLGGKDPYSASKAATEIAISAWQNLSEMNKKIEFISARAGNVIGGGDHSEDRLLPDLIRGFKANQKTIIRNPQSIRPWQHVLDPLEGYLKLGTLVGKQKLSKAYNFGPAEISKLTVAQMADAACDYWPNNPGYEIQVDPNNPPESQLLWLDSALAKKELGWQTKLSAKEAIDWTLEWQLKEEKVGTLIAMDEQITRFFGG